MSTIILNDVAMEGQIGERLLDVARRNAAHIGFMCDNAGTCQGCRCQVLAGGAQLSPPNAVEQAWIPADQLAEGHRLACQAVIQRQGAIQVLSRAEALRQLVQAVIAPNTGPNGLVHLLPLLTTLGREITDQLLQFPGGVLRTLALVGPRRFIAPIRDRQRLVDDAARVVQRMRAGTDQLERPVRVRPMHITLEIDDGATAEPDSLAADGADWLEQPKRGTPIPITIDIGETANTATNLAEPCEGERRECPAHARLIPIVQEQADPSIAEPHRPGARAT